jgi:glyoxylase-like metal-dependent hydrolase (beta-lactamase superfamily II)
MTVPDATRPPQIRSRPRLRRIACAAPEEIADGVWVLRGGLLRTMNVYLVRDGHGVLCFDAGIHSMVPALGAAAAQLGGLTKVVLGHGHADHRGAAPGLGVPVWCHAAERADAEADGGEHYMDMSKLDVPARFVMPRMLHTWDGGPVTIDRTFEEGETIAGFEVVHIPGHAPGMVALWREADRLALTSDCFYTLDPQTGMKGDGHPRLPHSAFNLDTEQARASVRKIAALRPAAAWPGHADPVTGDVAAQLEQAAATT